MRVEWADLLHWTSAMAAFGYVAGFYICLLLLEVRFAPTLSRVVQNRTAARIRHDAGVG
jgi:hypothetical protein